MGATNRRRTIILDGATALVALCAIALAGAAAWDRFTASDPISGREDRPVDDWRSYAADGHVMGAPTGGFVILEFGDYQCPWCRRLEPHLAAVQRAFPGEVRLVYRHFPLSNHQYAMPAARIAECAGRQNRFEAAHDLLYASEDLSTLNATDLAKSAGVADLEEFSACLQDDQVDVDIEADQAAAREIGLPGTPSLIVNGILLASTPDSLELIEMVRTRLAETPSGG
ncbi:MAG: thioredoxin domain-containing protein [Gemmatimonadota bacterium]